MFVFPLLLYMLLPLLYLPYSYCSRRERLKRVQRWQGKSLRCFVGRLLSSALLRTLFIATPLWAFSFAPLLLWGLGHTTNAISVYV